MGFNSFDESHLQRGANCNTYADMPSPAGGGRPPCLLSLSSLSWLPARGMSGTRQVLVIAASRTASRAASFLHQSSVLAAGDGGLDGGVGLVAPRDTKMYSIVTCSVEYWPFHVLWRTAFAPRFKAGIFLLRRIWRKELM